MRWYTVKAKSHPGISLACLYASSRKDAIESMTQMIVSGDINITGNGDISAEAIKPSNYTAIKSSMNDILLVIMRKQDATTELLREIEKKLS